MRFVSLVSDNESSSAAVEELIAKAREFTQGKVDVVFAFMTARHCDEAERIAEKLWLELDPQALIGCSGQGVIGDYREIEDAPGMALLVGDLNGVRAHPFHISSRDWKSLLEDPKAMADRVGRNDETRAVIGFGDPFSTPVIEVLQFMDEHAPGVPLIGGMASAFSHPGGNVLLRNDQVYNDGMVGLSLSGKVRIQTVVSQGCHPIGMPLIITRAHSNVIEQLGGRSALTVLSDLVAGLSDEDRRKVRDKGMMIGRAISEYKEKFGRGDFLVRQIGGVDESHGAISVGDLVRVGQTVQFHVHDAEAAHEDLELLLSKERVGDAPPAALLFTCNGRGRRLFAEANHDIGVAREAMPATAIAGFFAAGEVGPVGGKNFIHGHTASFALIREA
jgi:small ligand-binding sensory domain FIST